MGRKGSLIVTEDNIIILSGYHRGGGGGLKVVVRKTFIFFPPFERHIRTIEPESFGELWMNVFLFQGTEYQNQ